MEAGQHGQTTEPTVMQSARHPETEHVTVPLLSLVDKTVQHHLNKNYLLNFVMGMNVVQTLQTT